MTLDRVSVLLSNTPDVEELLQLAHAVEEVGYPRVWLAETIGLEAAGLGAVIARETTLEVGTAIVPVFSRTPALLSMMAATWSRLGGGDRPVHLGIGAGGQVIVERWHGVPFELPGTVTKDTLRILRQALAGERTDYEGKGRHSHGFRLALGPAPSVRLYIGGMGPAMMALAIEEADGLILTWQSPRTLVDLRRRFDEQARGVDRDPGACRLVARVYVAVTPTPEEAFEGVRKELVEYLVSPPYAKYFRSAGFEEEVEAVNARFAERDREATVRAVSDRLVDEILVVGRTGAEIRDKLQAYLDAGADEIMVQPVPGYRGGDQLLTITEVANALA
jgi:probable F420-dependent oxidoreductase